MPPAVAKAAAPGSGGPGKAAPGKISEVTAGGAPIVLDVDKGVLIRLPKPASTVFIANPGVADVQVKTPSLIYLTAKKPGETALYAVDKDDRVLLNAPVRVQHNLTRARESLSAMVPGQHVKLSSVENSLILSGKVANAGDAEKARSLAASIAKETGGTVVNRMSVATPNQVNIRVKVAEVDRGVLKELGLNWSKLGQHFILNTSTLSDPNANSIFVALGGANSQILGTLNVLATEGLVTTLAQPNLTATNGQPASFLAGGEFPVPLVSASSTANNQPTVTVTYKTYGVSLGVTPTIIDAQHIIMKIHPEVSQLSTNGAVEISGFSIPALTVRSADTTVELASGQSFMLAGLLQNDSTQNISKVPWLGDIPVLGQLFRSERFQHNESELVIIVTPYLVKPTLTSLAAPTDGFRVPHDAQSIISGDTYRQTLPAPARGPLAPGGQSLVGQVGFRLD